MREPASALWAAARLRGCLQEEALPQGQRLFSQGDVDERLYVIASGRIKLERVTANGRVVLLGLLGPDDMFGEPGVFDDEPRIAGATAVIDSRLLTIDKENLQTLLLERPDLALSLASHMSRQLRVLERSVSDLALQDQAGRLATVLLDLCTRFGTLRRDGVHVRHDLTQRELAQLIGSSRETVNKTLSEFADRGWLRIEAGGLLLRDPGGLRGRAQRGAGSPVRVVRHEPDIRPISSACT